VDDKAFREWADKCDREAAAEAEEERRRRQDRQMDPEEVAAQRQLYNEVLRPHREAERAERAESGDDEPKLLGQRGPKRRPAHEKPQDGKRKRGGGTFF
jgi:hypothetical protein